MHAASPGTRVRHRSNLAGMLVCYHGRQCTCSPWRSSNLNVWGVRCLKGERWSWIRRSRNGLLSTPLVDSALFLFDL
ncbi:hypothetical protein NEOLEDRAFT_173295 [Neolentinus lepideus HHB14362 ss-1]|uniref:Uncharacterized protein n=1 Tax=Neolentinus lepideus HHB14362 ss-1 TaxID=1314782 RepID=A0A165MI73_9AGAM|nr:hypothetical protein NEOLEDRAFT_173295 [Neolentinus lepideus HHB14362 ss-1]